MTLTLSYNKAGAFTQALVRDNTVGQAVHSSFDATVTYKSGSATAGFGPYTPQGGRTKLWAVKDVTLSTYTGHSGALGAFSPQVISMTSTGASNGTLYANPGSLWNAGQNFSVFAH